MAARAPAQPRPAAQPAQRNRPAARVEARSAQLLAVGTVHGERMTIHLSRLEDNAPVRDAEVALVLRGATHPATALADGGYAVDDPGSRAPGRGRSADRGHLERHTAGSRRHAAAQARRPSRRRQGQLASARLVGSQFRGLYRVFVAVATA